MGIIKEIFNKLKMISLNRRQVLNEGMEDFVSRITSGEKLTKEEILALKSININVEITQQDLNMLSQYCLELKCLRIFNIDATNLDFTVLSNIEQLIMDNVKFNEMNINCDKLKRIDILNRDFQENPIEVPAFLEELELYNCQNIECVRGLDQLKSLYIGNSDISKVDFNLPKLEYLSVNGCSLTSLDKFVNVCQNLKNLDISYNPIENLYNEQIKGKIMTKLEILAANKTGLKNIENIADMFPNLEKINLSETPLKNIKPLNEYNRELKTVWLRDTKIDESMLNVVQELGLGGYDIGNTPLQEYLKQTIVIGKNETDKAELKKYITDNSNLSADYELTEWDILEFDRSAIRVKPQLLANLLEIHTINKKIKSILIDINENDSIKQIIDILDTYTIPGRNIELFIDKIPNLSEEDIEVLNRRYGITFYYLVPIQNRCADLHQKNSDYRRDNIHIDELQKINEAIETLLQGKQAGENLEDKAKTVYDIMHDNFELMQEQYGRFSLDKNLKKKETQSEDGIVYMKDSEFKKYNDLETALKDKKVTSQSYIVIAKELMNKLGIEDVECAITKRDGKAEPIMKINDKYSGSNMNANIILNGKQGVTIQEENIRKKEDWEL